MSKKSRQLLVGLAFLVVIGAVVLVMTLLPVLQGMNSNEGSNNSSSAPTSSTVIERLVDCEESDVKGITIENKNGTFEIYPEDRDGEVTWKVEGYEGLTLLTASLNSLTNLSYDMRIIKNVGEVSDLSEYGLDKPGGTMTVRYKDGSKIVLKVGNITTTSETRCYAQVEGDDNVYILSCYHVIRLKTESLISPVIYDLDYMDSTYEEYVAPTYEYISVSGRDHPEEFRIVAKGLNEKADSPAYYYAYYFEKPYKVTAHVNFDDKFLMTLSTMTADHIEVVNPDAETLSKYGFDDPIKVEFRTNNQNYHFEVGNVDGELAYVTADGKDLIYAVPLDQLVIATGSMGDLRDSLAYLVNIDSVETVTIDINGGETYVVENEREVKEKEETSSAATSSTASSAEEEEIEYTYKYICNGEVLEHFNTFYGIFLENYREEDLTDDVRRGKLLFTVNLDHYDEFETKETEIKVYECASDDRRVILNINGRDDSLIKASWAERVLDALEKVLDGVKPVTY